MLPSISLRDLQVKAHEHGMEIWDAIRRRWLQLTPEEWVRQQLVAHLQQECGVPGSLMMLEKQVLIGERRRRFDLVVRHRNGHLWMLAECKAPEVPLTETTLSQALSYFSQLPCQYLLLTNGHQNMMWTVASNGAMPVVDWPHFHAAEV